VTRESRCALLGAPIGAGAGLPGCERGPDALRAAGLADRLRRQGWSVADLGDATPRPYPVTTHRNPALRNLTEIAGWIAGLGAAAREAGEAHDLPIFLGGDHALSAATVPAMAARAARRGRPFFVLWLDAHPDLHDLDSTQSGNLHGMPVAYFTGRPGFGPLPPLPATVAPENVCMIGLRSIDPAEAAILGGSPVEVHPMAELVRHGPDAALAPFLRRVKHAGGDLHVSFDMDFLDPRIAPAVGTAVPHGAFRKDAQRIVELVSDWGVLGSLDLVELNPLLDRDGTSAALMVDLATGLLGRPAATQQTGT
jgi:arginase